MGDPENQLNAVVLAGGVNRISLYDGYVPGNKALLQFSGRPSIAYTLDALTSLEQVNRICIVGPQEQLQPACAAVPQAGRCEYTAGADNFVGSVVNGLRHFGDSHRVLVLTADIPLVTSAAVREFLAQCAGQPLHYEENVFISVVPEACFTGEYAGSVKGFNRFRDLTICHGNALLVDPRILANAEARRKIDALYNARKNPLRAAMAIGLRLGTAYAVGVHLLHSLKLTGMAWLASLRFNIGIIPVVVRQPSLAVDIDEPADYESASKILAGRAETGSGSVND